MASPQRFRDLFEARERLSPAELRFERGRRTAGLVLGPLAFLVLMLLPPGGVSPEAARLTAVLAWVLTWWVTEAVPIPVTSILGPALAVITGVGPAKELFSGFGDPIIFLFLGSFIIAEGMHATGLDRRFAFAILSRPSVGSSSTRILVAFAAITAVLSMWLSNTATTAMLYPVAISVLGALSDLLSRRDGVEVDFTRLRYGTALMLVTAYTASLGGMATPVGTPPNLIAIGLLDKLAGIRIPFFQWMLVATPVALVLLTMVVVYMRWALPPEMERIEGSAAYITGEREKLGPWNTAQRNVLLAFACTVGLWVLPGVLAIFVGTDAALYKTVQRHLPEAVVALVGASLLFVLPVDWKERRFTLSWSHAARVDWGTLLLFGGGLSLGGAMFRTGLAKAFGRGLINLTGARSTLALSYLLSATSTILTETTSNTASTTMLCPLAIAAAAACGVSPVPVVMACALEASVAFLLPVSTPPNAIVYGSGCVPITAMLRHGAPLDLAGLAITPGATVLLCRALGL